MLFDLTFIRLRTAASALALAAAMSGCAVSLPPMPQNGPANPNAPEANTRPLRGSLIASSRPFLAADDRGAGPIRTEQIQSDAAASAYYTCPMHPEIKRAEPGNCPICGMILVKKPAAPTRPKR
jgi:hypothetical protein